MNLLFAILAIGVTVRTDNFIVDASTKELALEVAKQAESHRQTIAREWTGGDLPRWIVPCLLFVSEEEKPWGWTYHFHGEIRGISIRGSRDEIFKHSLVHEITHAVMLSYFDGEDIPRWCDEGMAISSELDCPHRLNGHWGKQPLLELFDVQTYPDDWEPFYGQGFSVTAYIVEKYGRQDFLKFIRQGRHIGWEKACFQHLHIDLANFENEWKQWHQRTFEMCGQRNHEKEVDKKRRHSLTEPFRNK